MAECIGRCCQGFSLPYDPATTPPALKQDGEQIAAMVIKLKWSDPDTGKPVYTCRNLTADLRCSIYDKRPQVCRSYPNGKMCGWCGYREPTEPDRDGVTFTCFVGVYSCGGGWYKMPDRSKVRGPLGVVAWMKENG